MPAQLPSADTTRPPAWVLVTLVAAIAVYTVGALCVPPAMFSDSGAGFVVWRSMERGAPFNHSVQADPQDIGRDAGAFLTWWTPGQYLIPGWLTKCGLSLGQALTVTTCLFSSLGVAGWYALYRRLGFSARVAALSGLVIAFNRFFVLPFGIYNGGEVLLFGGSPWLILSALWARRAGWHRALLIVPVFLAGFVLKSSALILELGLCLALAADALRSDDRAERRFGWMRWALVFALTYAISALLYSSRGPTPASVSSRLADDAVPKSLFAVAGPFLSSLSVDDGLSWVLSHPARPVLRDWQSSLFLVVPLVLVAVGAYAAAADSARNRLYRTLLVGFLGTYILVFGALNLFGGAVSSATEARHYRPAGLLLLPGLIAIAAESTHRLGRLAISVVVILAGLYGATSFANKLHYLRSVDAVGTEGFTQTSLDRAAVEWLGRTDAECPPGSALFYLTSPELALEVHNGRVLLSHANFESAEVLQARTYRGRVERLFVVLPDTVVSSGKAEIILASFRDYQRWDRQSIGASTVFIGRPGSAAVTVMDGR